MGPFAAAFINRYGVRKVTLSALSLIAWDLPCRPAMTHLWQLILLWGVVVGLGTGLTALVLAATISTRWFNTRRGLIVGLLTASSATGQLIFLPLLASVAARSGWRSALCVVCACWPRRRAWCGCSCATGPPTSAAALRNRRSAGRRFRRTRGVTRCARRRRPSPRSEHTDRRGRAAQPARAARTRTFWILFGTFFICGASTNGLIQTHFIPFCSDNGLAEIAAAGVLATMGVFDFFGTIASGWLSDRIQSGPAPVLVLRVARAVADLPAVRRFHLLGLVRVRAVLRPGLDRDRAADGEHHGQGLRPRQGQPGVRLDIRRPSIGRGCGGARRRPVAH